MKRGVTVDGRRASAADQGGERDRSTFLKKGLMSTVFDEVQAAFIAVGAVGPGVGARVVSTSAEDRQGGGGAVKVGPCRKPS